VTRLAVMEIAHDLGYEVREKPIIRTDLYVADELFMTGTAAEVTPIRSVDDQEIGDPGPVTKAIQETYLAAVTGGVDRYSHWLEHVPKSSPVAGS
jgi:branched-chain amino acid aminotransferase